MRIDVHTHLVNSDFLEYLLGRSSMPTAVKDGGQYTVTCTSGYRWESPAQITDVEAKLREMEEMGVDLSVLTHGIPGPELLGGSEADDWASRINDHLAEVVEQYPGKFLAWGSIGFGSTERSIAEVDRCINQLGFKGIQLFSNNNQKALDSPEFMPVYRHVAQLGVPMNMHPTSPLNLVTMENSPIIGSIAFIYDTTLATVRLILSGLFDQAPDLKLIVPHVGGVLPYLGDRVGRMIDASTQPGGQPRLEQSSATYMSKLYVDSVAHSSESLDFCYRLVGAERLLFGTDHPFSVWGIMPSLVDQLDCTAAERELIYHGNAERLLNIS